MTAQNAPDPFVEASIVRATELVDTFPPFVREEFRAFLADVLATHPQGITLRERAHPSPPGSTPRAAGPLPFLGGLVNGPRPGPAAADLSLDDLDLPTAQKALVPLGTPIVSSLVPRFAERFGPFTNAAQLLALAQAGLVKAAQEFQPEGDLPFDCFAWTRIHAALRDELADFPMCLKPDEREGLRKARWHAYDVLQFGEDPEDGQRVDGDGPLESFLQATFMTMYLGFMHALIPAQGKPSP